MTERSYTSKDLDPNITWTVNLERCIGSGECLQACPMNILILDDGKADCVDVEMCISCLACVNACPRDAVSHSES